MAIENGIKFREETEIGIKHESSINSPKKIRLPEDSCDSPGKESFLGEGNNRDCHKIELFQKDRYSRRNDQVKKSLFGGTKEPHSPLKFKVSEALTFEPTLSPPRDNYLELKSSIRTLNDLEESKPKLEIRRKDKHVSVKPSYQSTMATQKADDSIMEQDSQIRNASHSPIRNAQRKGTDNQGKASGLRQGYRYNSVYHSFIQKKKDTHRADLELQLRIYKEQAKISWEVEDDKHEWDNIEQNLKIGFKMGEGGFGIVYEGDDKILKLPVAIKVIDKAKVLKSTNRKELINSEVKLHSSLPHHENICRFYRVLEDKAKVFTHNLGLHRDGALWLADH